MKILIAVNGSGQTEVTMRFAAQFMHRAEKIPTVLSVMKPRSNPKNSTIEDMVRKAEKFLDLPRIIMKVQSGHLAQEIIRETAREKIDLLITGEIHTRRISDFLTGSRTIHVVESVPCPTIIVKGKTRRIRRILLCDSGAGRSSDLNQFTTRLAQMLEGTEEVVVLHVMSQISAGPGVIGKQLRASVGELIEAQTPEGMLLQRDIHYLEHAGIHSKPMVRHGLVVEEIISEAHNGNYDLIVIGAHMGKKWQHFLLENLAQKILQKSDRPVLLVN